MTTSLSRRSFIGLSAAAVAAASACGGPGAAEADNQLRLAWYGGDPVHKAMDAALAAYTGDHAEVKISTEHAPFADYWDKLATQTAGGKGPDVFRMSMSYFSEYAERGALLDLTSAVGSTIKVDSLDSDVATSGEVGGKMMGIGQSSISHACFVNPALAESVGGSIPKEWSWDSFAQFCTAFSAEAGTGKYGTSDEGGNFQIFDVFARQHGSELFDDAGLAIEQSVIEEWFSYWDELRRAKGAPPADVSAESGSFETSPLSKKIAAVEFGWVQQVTFYQPLVDSPIEVVPVPGKQAGSLEGQFIKALDFWTVSGSTKNAEGAQQLINFLLTDERAVKAIGVTLGVPPSPAARQLLAADPDSAPGRAIAYIDAITDKVGPAPAAWPKGYGELLSTFNRMNQDIAFGKSDPAKASAAFAAESQRILGG